MAVTKTVVANILATVTKRADLTPPEAVWLTEWAAKWTPDFTTKPEYTPRTVLTMTTNAAAHAASTVLS